MSAIKSGSCPELENSPTMQRVLAVLAQRAPLSAAEIAREASLSLSTLVNGGYLKRLKESGHIFVIGWGKNTNGFTIALFHLGNFPDCPRPKFQTLDRDSSGMAKIVAALKRRSALAPNDLALATGLSLNTIRGGCYMQILLEQQRVHICDWRRNRGGAPCPLYAFGAGKNAPKPRPLSKAEIRARHRARAAITEGHSPTFGQQLREIANI